MIKLKFWIFQNYWWISLIFFLVLLYFAFTLDYKIRVEIIISILTILISVTFFLQKQRLEELKLFKSLFKDFNKSYNELNENLNEINVNPNEELTKSQKKALNDYFNICGEEYLYYKQRYIHPEVWDTWRKGMKYFYKDKRIKELWDKELSENFYYGFSQKLLKSK